MRRPNATRLPESHDRFIHGIGLAFPLAAQETEMGTTPTPDDTAAAANALMAHAEALSGIAIPAENQAAVLAHLVNGLTLARQIGPGAHEAAPVFRP
ncbi:hypothetical protein RDV64_06435 [Acuticoccus sp. MNP-M23]|uniref:hypothetical protein n=1 Tax=Acuticoccus sp. MNP-M23 TaxID=3072793 RepID=UPI0028154C3F|nr:hypothetical protein [Acuticoccus sp. MNP-M23]WMS44022.1 hypothetical protein RDV64_06435 [Acuticoccus sp. MNP-M23]